MIETILRQLSSIKAFDIVGISDKDIDQNASGNCCKGIIWGQGPIFHHALIVIKRQHPDGKELSVAGCERWLGPGK
ncbi:hypothetical protein [Endozoicomonas sp. ONNA2]|uniref:hypothetical protein n=1 Tax=Endozoicomonas sp. ONNA2 TaxID=2828741 RepID=UPI00214899BC|nr:hypothetical protein [Endozoicomonas sp. ONNA2]